MRIDLNADLGEGAPHDADLMRLVSSANVCCGAHAGGPAAMRAAVELAAAHGVAVGAHPGYADREQFGRRELGLSVVDIEALVREQVGSLRAIADVKYVKPHGALYHRACKDPDTAAAVVRAVEPWGLAVVGLPASALADAANGKVPYVAEGYADRRYLPDGTLVPRTDPEPFVHDPHEAATQVRHLIATRHIRTVCVHGDNPAAVAFAAAVRAALVADGFTVARFA